MQQNESVFLFPPIFSPSFPSSQDATRDLVLLGEQFEAEYKLTKNLEILTDRLQQTYRELVSGFDRPSHSY